MAGSILLEGVSRFCSINTDGIYGLLFRDAWEVTIRGKVTRLTLHNMRNIFAMSAPQGKRGGKYSEELLEGIFRTAFSGFRATVLGSGEVTVHTGYWGCGAFGNNRQLMTALQMLAAGAARVGKLVFWIPNPAFLVHFQVGLGIARELAGFETKKATKELDGRGYTFAAGNGT